MVTTIATDELGVVFSDIPEIGKIQIHIPKLQFRNYSLTYMISEKLAFNTPHEIIDYLADAFVMSVIRGDYWKSGILNRPRGFVQMLQYHYVMNKSIAFFIQARTGSSRLPNKVLLSFDNENCILGILIQQLQTHFKQIPLVVCTSTATNDDAIVSFASLDVTCFREVKTMC